MGLGGVAYRDGTRQYSHLLWCRVCFCFEWISVDKELMRRVLGFVENRQDKPCFGKLKCQIY